MEPFPPVFVPGDLVEIIGVPWPPGSNKVKTWMGLFQEPGFPKSVAGLTARGADVVLNEKCVGRINNGDRCLVMAASFYEGDKKWYYLLDGGGFKRYFGWSRSSQRMRKIEP